MKNPDTKLSELTISSFIRILREITVLGIAAYLSTKLFSGELSLNFAKLTASELVGLLLAFFSIALSAAFYFAATNQSNQFYDNVNKFSKDTSELLGRLDEQVKGLGGRQTELRESIDKYYARHSTGGTERASERVEAKTKEAEQQIAKLVSDIMDRSNLSEPEREAFVTQLRARDAELASLREQLGRLSSLGDDGAARRYLKRKISLKGLSEALETSPDQLLIDIAKAGPREFRKDLVVHGFTSDIELTGPEAVTDKGKQLVMSILESLTESS